MTTQEKQNELIKYIQKEIPEIMKSYSVAEIFGESGSLTDKRQLYKAKIFYGRPITLEDVLRVIRKKDSFSNDMKLYNVRISIINSPEIDFIFNDDMGRMFNWNLGKDFNNQSEELYSFLYELLIKTV